MFEVIKYHFDGFGLNCVTIGEIILKSFVKDFFEYQLGYMLVTSHGDTNVIEINYVVHINP